MSSLVCYRLVLLKSKQLQSSLRCYIGLLYEGFMLMHQVGFAEALLV